jgi:LPXTG-motif cell wall-anchored protein
MHMGASESFADEMDVEETEDSYVLTYEGSGEEIEEAASKIMQSDMGSGMADEEMMEETWDMIDIHDVSMSLTVDKETHYMTASTINLDASYNMEEITTDMNLTADSTYSNFNSVDDITVPEEVMNEAVPMDEMEGMDGMNGMEDMPEEGMDGMNGMEDMPEEGMAEDEASMEEGAEGGEMPETASAQPAYMAGGLALAGLAGGALLWTRRRQQA